jgi:hypothetical protein
MSARKDILRKSDKNSLFLKFAEEKIEEEDLHAFKPKSSTSDIASSSFFAGDIAEGFLAFSIRPS